MIDEKPTGLRALIGKRLSKKTKFMETDVTIFKLTVSQVKALQEHAKAVENADEANLEVLKFIIRAAVDGGDALTDDDFNEFPVEELSTLTSDIMKFSGMTDEGK